MTRRDFIAKWGDRNGYLQDFERDLDSLLTEKVEECAKVADGHWGADNQIARDIRKFAQQR